VAVGFVVGVGVGAGVAVGAVEGPGAAEVGEGLGVGVAVGVGDGVGEGEAVGATDGDSDGTAEADGDGEAAASGVEPGTPTTKVIAAPSPRESVSWPLATDQVVAVVSAWANKGPNESSGHIARVVVPALIVMPFEPLVVYEPEIWLQSAVPLYVPSVLKVIV
jgi:hypothetical protein